MFQQTLSERIDERNARCLLCRHACKLAEGDRGICLVRQNRNGVVIPLSSGLMVAENIDPIEKKPLYHFLPGSISYSVASVGCNFSCRHCQNASIAKYDDMGSGRMPGRPSTPEAVVEKALSGGCRSISFTYTEPTVWFEFALETAKKAAEAGLYNVFVTNGYISSKALGMIAPFLHGANIDLKAFSNEFYSSICGASLSKTLDGIREYRHLGIWIEITTLVIPGLNDDSAQLEGIARFIADELGVETPWHVSRFFPQHLMQNIPPTPESSLTRALEAGDRAGLRYIYEGNVSGGRENTLCPACGALVISRSGFRVTHTNLRDGACGSCGKTLPGIWG